MKRLASKIIGRRDGTARTMSLASGLLLALALGAGCSKDEGNVTFPTRPTPPDMPWYYDVFGTAADNVYVAGNRGVMHHWNGAAWEPVDLGTTSAVTTIWGSGDGILYLCGHGGLIMRNTGAGWSRMDSGTAADLLGLGTYQQQVHAVGAGGAVRRLSGGAWQGVDPMAVIRNAQAGDAASDTLDLRTDIESLLTVNYNFIGGAYRLPAWRESDLGRRNTDGMVLTVDTPPPSAPAFSWQLRPLRGDELAPSEWIYCTTSDDVTLANNYLGTSEGWLFQLVPDEDNPGRLVWSRFESRISDDRNVGIRDMWLAASGDLYMVTDSGQIVYRSAAGVVREIYDQVHALVGIWGASPADFYVVGYMDSMILHCSYDPVADVFTSTPVTLAFPE